MKKTNNQSFSQLVWQSSLQEFSRILPQFMTLRHSVLIEPVLLNWSTNGKTRNIILRFSEALFPTWSNSSLRTDFLLPNCGHGSANMNWTSNQKKNSWSQPSHQRSRRLWAIWENLPTVQATQNNIKLMNIQSKNKTDDWLRFYLFIFFIKFLVSILTKNDTVICNQSFAQLMILSQLER